MKKSKRGFTFLELLITLALFSVVMVVISSVFSTGILSWRRGETESGFHHELRFTLDRMGREIRNTLPYEGIPFKGERDLCSFALVVHPRLAPTPRWVEVTYEVKREGEVSSLIRREEPWMEEGSEETEVLSSFSEISFSYPGFEGGEEVNWTWQENWEPGEEKTPPPFFRIELLTTSQKRLEKIFVIPSG